VLLIMTDDVGFGSSSTFGGPIPTPTLDALAKSGLRYNQFHTAAICSPTRAALLTGRNPHAVGVGNVVNLASGFPGYNSVIPKSAATVAAVLRSNGFNTAMFGKGHITPEWEMSQAGPFDRWPTGLGFEYFYGFLGADTSSFAPTLVENTTSIEPPHDNPAYHFENDLATHAIGWIRRQHQLAPAKPFFIYYATGAAHSPNHAPPDWLARFRGQFDGGWDRMREQTFARQKALGVVPRDAELTPRPRGLPAWDSLDADHRRLYARFMEAYAAALSYADHQIGRVIEELRQSGQLQNTLVIFIQGDNGASTEGRMDGRIFEQSGVNNVDEGFDYMLSHIDNIGGPDSYPLNTGGWGWALNTPFQYYKRVASHFGGTRNGLVISWPQQIKAAGGLRSQFHYVSDIMPTILEVAQVSAPATFNGVAQQPLDGISMRYTFAHPEAPSQRHSQVFEMMENLAIYKDGWIAATTPTATSWEHAVTVPLAQRHWELYDIRRDFSEARDLAASQPQRLTELQALFWREAARGQILPIHGAGVGTDDVPSLTRGRDHYVYAAGLTRVPESAAPHTLRHSFTITAQVIVPATGGEGVLVTQGGRYGGYAFYMHHGQLVFHYNALASRQYAIRTTVSPTPGAHTLTAEFKADSTAAGAGGTLTLLVDGAATASGRIEHTLTAWLSHSEGFDVGEDTVTTVNDDYTIADSKFTGELQSLAITLH
jgi:arylsulfatase